MTLRRLVLRILTLYICAGFFASTALAQKKYVTTVVAFKADSVPARTDDMLKISADDSDPIQSTSHAVITFALDNAIPRDAGISRATLRLVGRPATEYIAEQNSQLVKLVAIRHRESFVGQWNARPNESVFTASSESLRQVVAQAVLSGTLSIELTSRSRLSDWNYYGLSDKNFSPSFKPRLIVEYGMPQHLENDIQSTTRTSRIFLVGLEGKVKVVGGAVSQGNKVPYQPGYWKGRQCVRDRGPVRRQGVSLRFLYLWTRKLERPRCHRSRIAFADGSVGIHSYLHEYTDVGARPLLDREKSNCSL